MYDAQAPCGQASARRDARRYISGHAIIMRLGSTDEKVLSAARGELEQSGLNNLDSLLEIARVERERRRAVYRGVRRVMAGLFVFLLVTAFTALGSMDIFTGATFILGCVLHAGFFLFVGCLSMQHSTEAHACRHTFDRGMAVALNSFDPSTVHRGLATHYSQYDGDRRGRLYTELDRYGQVENLDAVSADHIIAILNVVRERDDVRAIRHIRNLMRYVQPEHVRQAASECLSQLRECARQPRASATLLRAASEPAARRELLRAAAPGTVRNDEQLLSAAIMEDQSR